MNPLNYFGYMKRIKIVHVISSLKIGGAENVLLTVIKNINKFNNNNFDQHVIYFHDGPIRPEIEKLNITTYNVKYFIKLYDPVFFINLIKLIKNINPDIIHSSLWSANFFGSIISRFLKIPIISSLHALQEHEGFIRNILNKLIINNITHFIAVSHGVKDSIVKKYNLNTSKITVITNAIDNNFIDSIIKLNKNNIPRKLLNINLGDFVIGSVGRFVKVKNYNLLLDSVAVLINKYKNIKILLVGIGPEYQALKDQAKSLNIENKVIFIVGQPAYNYYKLFDCFVQPSQYEGLSIALLEALYLKVPCIVSGDNNYHEVIQDNYTGLIIEPNNINDLIKKLEIAYQNLKLRNTLSNNGQDLINKKYNLKIMIYSYVQLFKVFAKNKDAINSVL